MLGGKNVGGAALNGDVWFGVAEINGLEKPSDKRCHAACWGSGDGTCEANGSEEVVVAVDCDVGCVWLPFRSCSSACRRKASMLRRRASLRSTSLNPVVAGTVPLNLIPAVCGTLDIAGRSALKSVVGGAAFGCWVSAGAFAAADTGGAGAGGSTRCIVYSDS